MAPSLCLCALAGLGTGSPDQVSVDASRRPEAKVSIVGSWRRGTCRPRSHKCVHRPLENVTCTNLVCHMQARVSEMYLATPRYFINYRDVVSDQTQRMHHRTAHVYRIRMRTAVWESGKHTKPKYFDFSCMNTLNRRRTQTVLCAWYNHAPYRRLLLPGYCGYYCRASGESCNRSTNK